MSGRTAVPTIVFKEESYGGLDRLLGAGRKRKAEDAPQLGQGRSGGAVRPRGGEPRGGAARGEISELMGSIREFSSSTLTGQSRLKHKDDKLVKLGAAPAKKQTMPFKMAMGIMRGREKRAEKLTARAKESGRVLAVASPRHGASAEDRGPARDAADFNIQDRRGVLHLDAKRLPGNLIRKGLASAGRGGV